MIAIEVKQDVPMVSMGGRRGFGSEGVTSDFDLVPDSHQVAKWPRQQFLQLETGQQQVAFYHPVKYIRSSYQVSLRKVTSRFTSCSTSLPKSSTSIVSYRESRAAACSLHSAL